MFNQKPISSLYSSARWWARLARQEEAGIKMGIVDPVCGKYRAEVYRRTARTLLYKRKTGIGICVCCYKPYGEPSGILARSARG